MLSRWIAGLCLLAAVGAALAQMTSRRQKVDVLRVGARLACQCGCKDTLASCSMLGCGFAEPARQRIAKMQGEGLSDDVIIAAFIKDYGQGIYRAEPASVGWIIPYVALALGLMAVVWFIRRTYFRKKPIPVLDPQLSRYSEQIEQELTKLD